MAHTTPSTTLWHVTALTLFPKMFPGVLGHSIACKALQSGLWQMETVDIRGFATDRHATVDDAPMGGGAGMVMRPDVLDAAIASVAEKPGPLLYLSPRGRVKRATPTDRRRLRSSLRPTTSRWPPTAATLSPTPTTTGCGWWRPTAR